MRVTVFIGKKRDTAGFYFGPAYYLVGNWQAEHLNFGDEVTVNGPHRSQLVANLS